MVRWGLVPFWAHDLSIGNRLINARCETVHSARRFREAYARRRCLVPADGFFEWQKQGKVRQPFLIRRKDQVPFAFAGLWERWKNRSDGTIGARENDLSRILPTYGPLQHLAECLFGNCR
jgi:putative SOS response-associated peptidase YedK